MKSELRLPFKVPSSSRQGALSKGLLKFGTGRRGDYERGLLTGRTSRISKISKFSRISWKWSESLLLSTVWRLSRISRISRSLESLESLENGFFWKDPFFRTREVRLGLFSPNLTVLWWSWHAFILVTFKLLAFSSQPAQVSHFFKSVGFKSVHTRCIVKGEAQKSPLFCDFWGEGFFQVHLFSRNSKVGP